MFYISALWSHGGTEKDFFGHFYHTTPFLEICNFNSRRSSPLPNSVFLYLLHNEASIHLKKDNVLQEALVVIYS